MPTLILTRGIPGSGKTTWAKKLVAERPDVVRVNRDNLRMEMFGEYFFAKKERDAKESAVTVEQHARVRAALAAGHDVVVDDTNVNPAVVNAWHSLAKEFDGDVQLKFQDFNVDPQECIRRDAARRASGDRGVGPSVIDMFTKRFLDSNGRLRPVSPSLLEPIRKPPAVEDRPNAVIFDMDGTLCDVRPVRHHVRGKERGKRNFHAFHTESEFCPPNVHVLEMAKDVRKAGLSVVIVTARDDRYRPLTERWLAKHGVDYDYLVTRPNGDSRPDYEVKRDIFADVSKHYRVVHAVDDNPNVLRLWKEVGVQVTEVPGFDDPMDPDLDARPLPIDSPIKGGRCLKCNRKMNRDGVLGPECAKQV